MVCTSEAKTFNLAAIADSMAILPNPTLREAFKNTANIYNLGATNALTRVALEAAYSNGETWLNALIKTIELHVACVEEALVGSKIKLIKPEGTYQVWLDFRAIFNDSNHMFNYMTSKSKVAFNAGHWFGREGALFMRLNLATSKENVMHAITKIKAAAALV